MVQGGSRQDVCPGGPVPGEGNEDTEGQRGGLAEESGHWRGSLAGESGAAFRVKAKPERGQKQ